MNSSTHLSLLFTILLIFIPHVISQTSTPKLYEVVCKNASNDDLEQRCLNLFEDNHEITLAKDDLTLCKLFLNMAIHKSSKAKNYLKSLINKYPSSKVIKKCVTDYYDDLVFSLKSSLSELVKNPLLANYDAVIAGDGPKNCESDLGREKIVNSSSISTINNEMQFLSYVAYLATANL
uniref:Uncharacterized protein LOC113787081 n=1 Tax=Cicer arietinum TaxID=3827 RepID=A0A3Q7Y1K7_CICAR|nr:uncharacterized protein LOC113787081 [Cicer arietinum]